VATDQLETQVDQPAAAVTGVGHARSPRVRSPPAAKPRQST
jgi:hypothetical protein